VVAIYVEATAADTEARLLKGLRRRCPGLPTDLDLVGSLTALRRGRYLSSGKKVLLVLDQFEQWLHAKREEDNTELVQALRQCDGGRVQCIVLVRDDFGMAATRFMAAVDVPIVQGQNFATVDLFDRLHARKVLAEFGRAFGRLPDRLGTLSGEQETFLDQAVEGLTQEGKIISVRLALFAEMVKGKPWTQATLREVGGTEGVGVTFLEETFTASTAPPLHRLHHRAAQAVLKALMPESGTDIKGHMRSHAALVEAAGYTNRLKEFDDLIRILDSEIRLITPTDPESDPEGVTPPGPDGTSPPAEGTPDGAGPRDQKYYQLTHDYLVRSLRNWLTRKQKETRRGRAELLLADRAGVWNARPESRLLPSFLQWVHIWSFTRKEDWKEPERKMMRKATWHHATRAVALAMLLLVAALAGLVIQDHVARERQATRAAWLVQGLVNADIARVPGIVDQLSPYRIWADPLLREQNASAPRDSKEKLNTSLALLPVDASQRDYLLTRLWDATPSEAAVLCDALAPHKAELLEKLWVAAEAPAKGQEHPRLRAACALAAYDPVSPRWAKVQEQTANEFVAEPPVYLERWMEALRPVSGKLREPLAAIYRDRDAKREPVERTLAANILADYEADHPEVLADLLSDADEKQFNVVFRPLKQHGKNAAKPLLAELERQPQPAWPDANLKPSAKEPDAELKRRVEAAVGFLETHCALCQTMLLSDFLMVAEALRPFGYRPVRFRPYAAGPAVQVAAVWTRDGQEWRLAHGLSAEEVSRRDAENLKMAFVPVDVAVYQSNGQERYAALWLKSDQSHRPVLAAGRDAKQLLAQQTKLREQGYWHATTTLLPTADGTMPYAVLWTNPGGRRPSENDSLNRTFLGAEGAYAEESQPGDLQVDVHVSLTGKGERRYAALWQPVGGLTSTWSLANLRFQLPKASKLVH
jgi:hypothetical protein